jgi:hypothetical protein
MSSNVEQIVEDTGAPEEESSSSYVELHSLRLLAGFVLLWIAVATVAYTFLEDWSLVDSLYFSTVAITTVGFGDLAPSSDASKLFTILYLAVGITTVSAFINLRLSRQAHEVTRRSRRSIFRRGDTDR